MTTTNNDKRPLAALVRLNDEHDSFAGYRYLDLRVTFCEWNGKHPTGFNGYDNPNEPMEYLCAGWPGNTELEARKSRQNSWFYGWGNLELSTHATGYIRLNSSKVEVIAKRMRKAERQLEAMNEEFGRVTAIETQVLRMVRACGCKIAVFDGGEYEDKFVAVPLAGIESRVRKILYQLDEKYLPKAEATA